MKEIKFVTYSTFKLQKMHTTDNHVFLVFLLNFFVSIFQVKQCGITREHKECNKSEQRQIEMKIRPSPYSTHSPKRLSVQRGQRKLLQLT